MSSPFRAAYAAAALYAVLNLQISNAQTLPPSDPGAGSVASSGLPLFVTVTANRSPLAIQRTGSAISVISEETIRKANPASMADVLRQVPGLSLTETGGPGAVTPVRMRGADARHTLVLVDGIRVNDATSVGGDFDFGGLAPGDIERIEVLRGPQSALYGSDAIGGVINIITRRGRRGPPRAYIQVEGGSYATKSVRAGISGATEDVSYAFSVNALQSAGFSRFGHRVRRIESALLRPLENDSVARGGASGRVAWRPLQGVEFEIGGTFSRTLSQTDNAFGTAEDTPDKYRLANASGFAKATVESFEGRLRNSVTLFAHRTERQSRCAAFGFNCFYQSATNPLNFNSANIAESRFTGERRGVEYQGDLKLGQFGTLIFGARHEREDARFGALALSPRPDFGHRYKANRVTNSVFALHQLPIGDRTDLSFGARLDKPDDTRAFLTWRATAAHRITETGTKLRASIGTGAKAPSLYQQFSIYGPLASRNPALRPERSLGYDVGIDQELLGGKARVSATLFENRFRNFIEFDGRRGLINNAFFPFTFPVGQYVNLSRAHTRGIELSAEATIIDGLLSTRGSFTWQEAKTDTTFGGVIDGAKLLRRPTQQGFLAFTLTPLAGLTIEPHVTFVGKQVDQARLPGTFSSFRRNLAPYATVGLKVDYAITPNLTVYARGENLTNARYQEVFNYGTAGRSGYVGLRATW
ncbi:MAG: TonB-dependent receptor plug domain-containing protein [Beijerinckiaceae bacterium]